MSADTWQWVCIVILAVLWLRSHLTAVNNVRFISKAFRAYTEAIQVLQRKVNK